MSKKLPDINHKTVVFTKHARERLDLRRIGEDAIIQVMRNPKATYPADKGKIKFIGKTMGAKVHAVCKPIPEENKWLVITLWVRGEDDKGNFVNQRNYRGKQRDVFTQYMNYILGGIVLIVIFLYAMLSGG